MKILHPDCDATDKEFEEYVAYALEARRRVKEQMNKRKPDDEFANINLSYIDSSGNEIIVYCPESRDAEATQKPSRKGLNERTEDSSDVANESAFIKKSGYRFPTYKAHDKSHY